MKKFTFTLTAALFFCFIQAQKIDSKNDIITIDGKPLAKINKIKAGMGMTNSFEVLSLKGDKLIEAVYNNSVAQRSDDPNNYYTFTFVTTNQTAVFPLAKLGAQKSFVQLVAKAGIIVDDKLDAAKVKDFIDSKGTAGAAPSTKEPEQGMISRNRAAPITLNDNKTIEQEFKTIGSFRDVTEPGTGYDAYEFMFPSGEMAARVTFSGGNNAQQCIIETMKDGQKRSVAIPSKDHVNSFTNGADRNQIALLRIIQWLSNNRFL